jgi:hypothetical protein
MAGAWQALGKNRGKTRRSAAFFHRFPGRFPASSRPFIRASFDGLIDAVVRAGSRIFCVLYAPGGGYYRPVGEERSFRARTGPWACLVGGRLLAAATPRWCVKAAAQ